MGDLIPFPNKPPGALSPGDVQVVCPPGVTVTVQTSSGFVPSQGDLLAGDGGVARPDLPIGSGGKPPRRRSAAVYGFGLSRRVEDITGWGECAWTARDLAGQPGRY
jgi:hypothetical protein